MSQTGIIEREKNKKKREKEREGKKFPGSKSIKFQS
jgi:hypothetical protein